MPEPRVPQRPLLPLWAATSSAALAAVLMFFSYPAAAVWILAFPATALLLVALIGRRFGGALLVGLVYGILFFGLLVSWTSRYLGPIPWAALSVVEGVLTALALVPIALAYRWLPRAFPGAAGRLLGLPNIVAALWVGRELFVGSWPYGGFPWARIGMSQAESPLAPISSWVGVSGLSFLMVLIVAMLIEVVRLRAWRTPLRLVVPAVLVVVLLFTPLFPTSSTGSMRIAAVQGNGPTGYFDEREPFAVVQAQTDATAPLYGEDVDLLVWPEGSLDGDPFQIDALARRMTLISNRIDAPLLANAATGRDDRYFNTSMLWNADGTATQVHDKRHPVPFGEYVPDRAFFNALAPDLIGLIQREYTPGSNPPIVDVDGDLVGLAICFDVIYDDVIWQGLNAGAEVLVFQTNNADFRGTDENLQQLAFARMRAIETGRSVVNVSTVGTSQVIRADGSTVTSLDADEAGAMLEDVELRSGLTAGVVLGPWVQAILLWGGLGALLVGWWRARKR
ncbi:MULTISPECIES: apolipoprotein N-acyltransferase [unclassified Microbacterium]|uniref:apolipoprotein N-acyltransferase n=1 Tax=unclassified Microbacterium TaxID=2609290 RepID=UPI000CFB427E|nr:MULTISPECIES: apolipoprotein N-acyltransferase [unclassified Microbacterium]PQZ61405.1 apolipoprotein N-acyltransferase [Microbacterium sp. MYb43]PQZ82638.1 apolipoprotein N-acyltransferase [Microbacterium sp. MYb40]PRB24228.1 apolipoprotein N-acyltransferase [Microbacterium sp. MYb54]PRB30999.1 apolipoprotein N-acyltransferase [Microbacterium sp. MYb50]PRB71062.1 apolipoprotein N-acyltransferase [Microbacterium sp. MYb24]